jgi:hypothetical protein
MINEKIEEKDLLYVKIIMINEKIEEKDLLYVKIIV